MSPKKPKEKTNTKKTSKKRVVLLDAHAIIHRAYHALPDFTTRNGEPTGGLYGVAAMLMKIIGELNPDYIAACFDLPEPTFRHEAYDAYKAGRAKAEDDLIAQINRSRDIFEAFHIPIYEKAGFEADDILGTVAAQLKSKKDVEVIIASGDMDTLQLVDNTRVQVYTLRKGLSDTMMYDEDAVVDRFGFPPTLLADFKGLRGDPSDNIPGIAGIGEKTATTLITAFGSIDDIYKTLKKDEKTLEKEGVKTRIINLLKEGEEDAQFSKTLATIKTDVPITFEIPKTTWREAVEQSVVEQLFADLEFRSLSARVKDLFGEDTGASESRAEGADSEESEAETDPRTVRETAIALWLLRSDITTPTKDDVLQYAGTDSFAEAREKILAKVKEHNLTKVLEDIELPLIPIVEAAEQKGILVDVPYLKQLSEKYHKKLDTLEQSIWDTAGEEFNINSPKQLSEVLFDKMELPTKGLKKTPGGARSTRESELKKLAGAHAIIDTILDYREVQKLLSTYIDNIPPLVDEKNRLHTNLHQAGTTTGRFSSTNPNLQNIPTREGMGTEVRNAFIASEGYVLCAFDYSQIEMRILAVLAEDEKMIDFFKRGEDIHTGVASQVFGVEPNEVTKEHRRKAKVINFGIIYGMGVGALQQNLDGSRKEAQEFYNAYFDTFPKIAQYFEQVKKEAADNGYTETLFGRRRYFEGIHSHIPYIRAGAERQALNAPVQGTAADVIKIAMRRVHETLIEKEMDTYTHLLLQVHDELMYEVKKGKEESVNDIVKHTMESAVDFAVPLVVDVKSGERWGDIK